MNQEQIADKLKEVLQGREYSGSLTSYAVKSIISGRSNYPVLNLITFCNDLGLKLVMTDMATEDCYDAHTILDVHKTLVFLMDRYEVDSKLVYRKTAAHYTVPKALEEKELAEIKSDGNKYVTSLSIKTLLAVCEVIHCDLSFEN